MHVFKKIFTIILLILCMSITAKAQDAEKIVQANLDAYNNRNLNEFMSYFSDDAKLIQFSDQKILAEGKVALEKLYGDLFEQSPALHSTILKRMVFGNKVIDHESIIGRKGANEAIELIMIYEVKDSKIFKMTVLRPNT
jgi:hypothetical protein